MTPVRLQGPEIKAACLGEESPGAALWAGRHQGGWKTLLPGRGGRGKARLSLEDRVEMSSSDARELRGDSKKRWRNLDEAKRAELLLLCLEMYAASPANGEKPQSSIFLERLQNLQWSYSLENMMHMENLGSLLGLREACMPVDPVWWAQTQQAEDRPSTWEKSEVPASTKSSSCPVPREKISSSIVFLTLWGCCRLQLPHLMNKRGKQLPRQQLYLAVYSAIDAYIPGSYWL